MRALLYIKGQREPVVLEQEEGVAAQQLIGNSTKPKDTPFVIEGVWSGTKADMRYVVFPKKEETPVAVKVEPMEAETAKAFEAEIEQDKKHAAEIFGETKDGVPKTFKWAECFYERKGAIRLVMKDITIGDRKLKHSEWLMKDSSLLMELERQVESYYRYKDKVEFAEKKKLEQLDEIATQQQNSESTDGF